MAGRIGAEADEMARRADHPQTVLEAIKDSHGGDGLSDEDEA